jgi:hypothetical protein
MAQLAGTTDTFDLVGLAEDVEDVIFNISPTETPVLSASKRIKASAVNHQWQTDSLAAPAANRSVEGDDSTYATVSPTTMLSNYAQISKKTVMVSGTADAVRKYGRKEEFAYQIAKKGRELKRDIELAIVGNQGSSAGSTSVARSSAGLESMIAGNRVLAATTNSVGTTAGYSSGAWTSPVDGTTAALTETTFVEALQAAWEDGGDASMIVVPAALKRKVAQFAGSAAFAGVSVNQNQGRVAQGAVIGGVDLYISDFGEHKIVLNRYMRTRTVLCLDPEYISTAWLRPIKFEERAKTGDATRGEILGEWCLVVGNPDAHAKVQDAS